MTEDMYCHSNQMSNSQLKNNNGVLLENHDIVNLANYT